MKDLIKTTYELIPLVAIFAGAGTLIICIFYAVIPTRRRILTRRTNDPNNQRRSL